MRRRGPDGEARAGHQPQPGTTAESERERAAVVEAGQAERGARDGGGGRAAAEAPRASGWPIVREEGAVRWREERRAGGSGGRRSRGSSKRWQCRPSRCRRRREGESRARMARAHDGAGRVGAREGEACAADRRARGSEDERGADRARAGLHRRTHGRDGRDGRARRSSGARRHEARTCGTCGPPGGGDGRRPAAICCSSCEIRADFAATASSTVLQACAYLSCSAPEGAVDIKVRYLSRFSSSVTSSALCWSRASCAVCGGWALAAPATANGVRAICQHRESGARSGTRSGTRSGMRSGTVSGAHTVRHLCASQTARSLSSLGAPLVHLLGLSAQSSKAASKRRARATMRARERPTPGGIARQPSADGAERI
jgi:hypothetical protein